MTARATDRLDYLAACATLAERGWVVVECAPDADGAAATAARLARAFGAAWEASGGPFAVLSAGTAVAPPHAAPGAGVVLARVVARLAGASESR